MAGDPGDEAEPYSLARRQRELASLYATAKSLTALGELDEVLQSIVHHAHDLIGTDFTYLSLVGADGRLSARASEGTISAVVPRGVPSRPTSGSAARCWPPGARTGCATTPPPP